MKVRLPLTVVAEEEHEGNKVLLSGAEAVRCLVARAEAKEDELTWPRLPPPNKK